MSPFGTFCLKIQNYYLKTFVKILVVEKKYVKIHVILFKN